MATSKIKTMTITAGAGTTTFLSENVPGASSGPDVLITTAYRNFINIKTPITPSAGTFSCYVEQTANGGFHRLADLNGANISVIDATKTGAQVADGEALSWEFYGPAHRVKISAIGVTGVSSVDAEILQFNN